MANLINTLRCRLGYHRAVVDHSHWANGESGSGFNVSHCRDCGVEMTKLPGQSWKAITSADRV